MRGIRTTGALGILFVVGLVLAWASFTGHTGALLAAVLCPAQLTVGAAGH